MDWTPMQITEHKHNIPAGRCSNRQTSTSTIYCLILRFSCVVPSKAALTLRGLSGTLWTLCRFDTVERGSGGLVHAISDFSLLSLELTEILCQNIDMR